MYVPSFMLLSQTEQFLHKLAPISLTMRDITREPFAYWTNKVRVPKIVAVGLLYRLATITHYRKELIFPKSVTFIAIR